MGGPRQGGHHPGGDRRRGAGAIGAGGQRRVVARGLSRPDVMDGWCAVDLADLFPGAGRGESSAARARRRGRLRGGRPASPTGAGLAEAFQALWWSWRRIWNAPRPRRARAASRSASPHGAAACWTSSQPRRPWSRARELHRPGISRAWRSSHSSGCRSSFARPRPRSIGAARGEIMNELRKLERASRSPCPGRRGRGARAPGGELEEAVSARWRAPPRSRRMHAMLDSQPSSARPCSLAAGTRVLRTALAGPAVSTAGGGGAGPAPGARATVARRRRRRERIRFEQRLESERAALDDERTALADERSDQPSGAALAQEAALAERIRAPAAPRGLEAVRLELSERQADASEGPSPRVIEASCCGTSRASSTANR